MLKTIRNCFNFRDDIAVYNLQNELMVVPKNNTVSSCINLFWTIFRTNGECSRISTLDLSVHSSDKQNPSRQLNSVIHTHSIEANLMASFPIGSPYYQVQLSNEEMLKGIVDRSHGTYCTNMQTVLVPGRGDRCKKFK